MNDPESQIERMMQRIYSIAQAQEWLEEYLINTAGEDEYKTLKAYSNWLYLQRKKAIAMIGRIKNDLEDQDK